MAARAYSGKKPKNLKHTLRVFLSYLGRHKKMLAVVAVLVTISAGLKIPASNFFSWHLPASV